MTGKGSPHAAAELTWGLVLCGMRHLPEEVENLKAGRWQRTLGTGLKGRTMGIFGLGKIGSLVARYAQAFEMNVLVWGREGTQSSSHGRRVNNCREPQDLFKRADVLSLHLRLNDETRGIVTADHLACMKPTALLVNTSRAPLIASGALVSALEAGRPGRAAVSMFSISEPTCDDPLLTLPNCVATPHLGYVEKDSYELYFGDAFANVVAFSNGEPVTNLTS